MHKKEMFTWVSIVHEHLALSHVRKLWYDGSCIRHSNTIFMLNVSIDFPMFQSKLMQPITIWLPSLNGICAFIAIHSTNWICWQLKLDKKLYLKECYPLVGGHDMVELESHLGMQWVNIARTIKLYTFPYSKPCVSIWSELQCKQVLKEECVTPGSKETEISLLRKDIFKMFFKSEWPLLISIE